MPVQYIDKDLLNLIRERLWSISNSSGITLEDIQDRTKFSYSQVYRVVRGTGNTSISAFIAVCQALEVQPSEIFNFNIPIPKYPPIRKLRKSKSR